MAGEEEKRKRTIVYIDGFNLYFALGEKNWHHFMWLDVTALARNITAKDQDLVAVKYFTSRVRNNPAKQKRQSAYLDALGTRKGLEIFLGNYQSEEITCMGCARKWENHGEKQTDVNIAVQMLKDAHFDRVDDLILITADSDQCPAIEAVREVGKTVIVGLPPGRSHYLEIQMSANKNFEITARHLRSALLPESLTLASGFVLTCIPKWKPDPSR